MSKIDKPPASNGLPMRAVVLYDDVMFAAKADATLRCVGNQAGVNVQWTIKCWPVNALNETAGA